MNVLAAKAAQGPAIATVANARTMWRGLPVRRVMKTAAAAAAESILSRIDYQVLAVLAAMTAADIVIFAWLVDLSRHVF